MNPLSPIPPIPRWCFVVPVVLILLLTPVDGWIVSSMPEKSDFERGDLLSLFRVLGYLPTWILVAVVLWAARRGTGRSHNDSPSWSLVLTPLISGAVSEALKPIFRRPDPQPGSEGSWQRSPLGEAWWDGTDFCFPSGHSAVAFGAALAICRRWPGTTPWILFAATGCAATRIIERGHYPTDVLASLLIALVVSQWIEPVISARSGNHSN